jgi:hypothetical protein
MMKKQHLLSALTLALIASVAMRPKAPPPRTGRQAAKGQTCRPASPPNTSNRPCARRTISSNT